MKTEIDRARARVQLVKLEAAITGPEVDALELQHLQPLRDEPRLNANETRVLGRSCGACGRFHVPGTPCPHGGVMAEGVLVYPANALQRLAPPPGEGGPGERSW